MRRRRSVGFRRSSHGRWPKWIGPPSCTTYRPHRGTQDIQANERGSMPGSFLGLRRGRIPGSVRKSMTAPETNDAALTVLLVEDEETIVEFLTMGLTYEGFTVHAVRDGREALPAFERTH